MFEDCNYEADNGYNQDILTGDEPASEDLPEIGTWGHKVDAADVKFGETLTEAAIDGREVQRDILRSSRRH